MLKITIVALGNIKNKNLKGEINEYFKRLSVNAKIIIEEIKPEPFFDNSDHDKIKKLEGDKILRSLEKYSQDKIIILDERGKELTSREFSEFLSINNQENIIFVIGGALGLSEEVLNYPGATKISLSKMTFLHEMTRLILVEQIYRAIAIGKNKKYHY